MESKLPYVNNLIEEKTELEKELQKSIIENKRKDHLIEVAKRVKADELMRLQQQCEKMKLN